MKHEKLITEFKPVVTNALSAEPLVRSVGLLFLVRHEAFSFLLQFLPVAWRRPVSTCGTGRYAREGCGELVEVAGGLAAHGVRAGVGHLPVQGLLASPAL